MTQEEKMLLVDLSTRLPYGVMVYIEETDEVEELYCVNIPQEAVYTRNKIHHNVSSLFPVKLVKPYLRSMSSMTEEENKEFAKIVVKSQDCSYQNNESATTMLNDWYLSKGFDVRGLIPKGLALEASEEMYNIKEQ